MSAPFQAENPFSQAALTPEKSPTATHGPTAAAIEVARQRVIDEAEPELAGIFAYVEETPDPTAKGEGKLFPSYSREP